MSTKKELEKRIAALEVEVAQLRTQVAQKQPGVTLPAPGYPYRYPQIWCDTSTMSPAMKNTYTINCSAPDTAQDLQQKRQTMQAMQYAGRP